MKTNKVTGRFRDGYVGTGGHMVAAKVFTTRFFIANVKNSNVKKKKSQVTGLMEFRNDL